MPEIDPFGLLSLFNFLKYYNKYINEKVVWIISKQHS